jgi:hypothetical protein
MNKQLQDLVMRDALQTIANYAQRIAELEAENAELRRIVYECVGLSDIMKMADNERYQALYDGIIEEFEGADHE